MSLRSVLGTQDRRSWRDRIDGRTVRMVLAVVVIAAGIVVGAGLGRATPPTAERRPAPAAPDVAAPAGSPEASATTSSTMAVRLWPSAEVRVEGRHVSREDGRWEVGADGDVIVVGDWDCDRLPTPAVLRPSTGEVAVFDRWAGDAPERARSVATLAGVIEVQATERCGELLARGPAGDQLVDTKPGAS